MSNIDLTTGKEAQDLSPAEVAATEDRCLLSFGFTIQVMEAIREHGPIANHRLILAASSFDLSFEHHGAIARLCQLGHYGSANALIRPLLESMVAGLWLMYCCNDKTAAQMARGQFATNMNAMLRQLQKKLGKRISLLKKFMEDEPGKLFHGFTHGGMDQLRWRLPYAGAGNNHGHKQIVASLVISDLVMVNAADAASLIYKSDALRVVAEKWLGQVMSEVKTTFGVSAEEGDWQPYPPIPE